MRTSVVALALLLITAAARPGEDWPPSAAILDFEVSEDLAETAPGLSGTVRRFIERRFSSFHRVLEVDPKERVRGAADAARLGKRLGAGRVIHGAIETVDSRVVAEIFVRDGRTGVLLDSAGFWCATLKDLPKGLARALSGLLDRATATAREGLRKQIEELLDKISDLQDEIDGLRGLERFPPRRDLPRKEGLVDRFELDAMVTGVSSKVNLIILSVGREDGVRKGYEFTVYRGNEYVGKVVVDRVEKDHCTAHSDKSVEKTPIRVGDKATTKF